MNNFEKQINELRIQFCREREQISKDAYRTIGHLNNAISQSPFPEVRDALRAEKNRIYETMRNSHRYNRLCYLQQRELLEDQYAQHREQNPSRKKMRRLMAQLQQMAKAQGKTSLAVFFGDNRQVTIKFG